MRPSRLIPAVFVLAALGGCSDGPTAPSPQGSVTVLVDHEVDGVPLAFDTLAYVNPGGLTYQVEKLRYYVSDLALRRADGTFYETEGVHYRDAELDDDTRAWTVSSVPDGVYDQVRFTFGLDEGWNVSDGSALPLTIENLNMQWPDLWGGGYHYMMFEGKYRPAPDSLEILALHTGATIPDGDTVRYHHFFTVTLPASITVDGDAWDVRLVMNLNEWFHNPQDYLLPDHPETIMRHLPSQQLLMENGQDVFTVTDVSQPAI